MDLEAVHWRINNGYANTVSPEDLAHYNNWDAWQDQQKHDAAFSQPRNDLEVQRSQAFLDIQSQYQSQHYLTVTGGGTYAQKDTKYSKPDSEYDTSSAAGIAALIAKYEGNIGSSLAGKARAEGYAVQEKNIWKDNEGNYSSDRIVLPVNDVSSNAPTYQSSYEERALDLAGMRSGFTDLSSIGDSVTQRAIADNAALRALGINTPSDDMVAGRTLEAQRKAAYLTPGMRDDMYFGNELQKWAQNKVEVSSAYHHMGMDAGIPIPPNRFEYQGDLAVEFLKGKPQKDSEMFSPVSGEMSPSLPNGGLGLQQYQWNQALATDRGESQPGQVSFSSAIEKLGSAEGQYGVYGTLSGMPKPGGVQGEGLIPEERLINDPKPTGGSLPMPYGLTGDIIKVQPKDQIIQPAEKPFAGVITDTIGGFARQVGTITEYVGLPNAVDALTPIKYPFTNQSIMPGSDRKGAQDMGIDNQGRELKYGEYTKMGYGASDWLVERGATSPQQADTFAAEARANLDNPNTDILGKAIAFEETYRWSAYSQVIKHPESLPVFATQAAMLYPVMAVAETALVGSAGYGAVAFGASPTTVIGAKVAASYILPTVFTVAIAGEATKSEKGMFTDFSAGNIAQRSGEMSPALVTMFATSAAIPKVMNRASNAAEPTINRYGEFQQAKIDTAVKGVQEIKAGASEMYNLAKAPSQDVGIFQALVTEGVFAKATTRPMSNSEFASDLYARNPDFMEISMVRGRQIVKAKETVSDPNQMYAYMKGYSQDMYTGKWSKDVRSEVVKQVEQKQLAYEKPQSPKPNNDKYLVDSEVIFGKNYLESATTIQRTAKTQENTMGLQTTGKPTSEQISRVAFPINTGMFGKPVSNSKPNTKPNAEINAYTSGYKPDIALGMTNSKPPKSEVSFGQKYQPIYEEVLKQNTDRPKEPKAYDPFQSTPIKTTRNGGSGGVPPGYNFNIIPTDKTLISGTPKGKTGISSNPFDPPVNNPKPQPTNKTPPPFVGGGGNVFPQPPPPSKLIPPLPFDSSGLPGRTRGNKRKSHFVETFGLGLDFSVKKRSTTKAKSYSSSSTKKRSKK